jgi:hypothetical protein
MCFEDFSDMVISAGRETKVPYKKRYGLLVIDKVGKVYNLSAETGLSRFSSIKVVYFGLCIRVKLNAKTPKVHINRGCWGATSVWSRMSSISST